jgi:hypothetical protein
MFWESISMVAFWGLLCLFPMLSHILLGLCVYYDARALANGNPAMWGMLCVVLGWLPAAIYLSTRRNARYRIVTCPRCFRPTPLHLPTCRYCGAPNIYAQFALSPTAERDKKRARGFLIAWIAVCAVILAAAVLQIASGGPCAAHTTPPQAQPDLSSAVF